MIENYITKRVKHPVENYVDYLTMSADEFSELWDKTIPFSFHERFNVDVVECGEFIEPEDYKSKYLSGSEED
jgi:hypothetical protein